MKEGQKEKRGNVGSPPHAPSRSRIQASGSFLKGESGRKENQSGDPAYAYTAHVKRWTMYQIEKRREREILMDF